MSREELIEEARAGLRAFDEYWGDGGPVDAAYGRPWELIRRLLAVFEKAHTPSSDEVRVATLAAVKKGARSDTEAVANYREAERVIRAAIPHLRRTVQDTPSSDEQVFYCPRHGDLLPREDDSTAVRSYRCEEAHTVAQIHAGFRRTVQDEPTDAQREAAMDEAWGFRAETRPIQEKWNAQHWFDLGWRAALRAAFAVTGEEGEGRD